MKMNRSSSYIQRNSCYLSSRPVDCFNTNTNTDLEDKEMPIRSLQYGTTSALRDWSWSQGNRYFNSFWDMVCIYV